jgi:hypothetical protein
MVRALSPSTATARRQRGNQQPRARSPDGRPGRAHLTVAAWKGLRNPLGWRRGRSRQLALAIRRLRRGEGARNYCRRSWPWIKVAVWIHASQPALLLRAASA